MVGVFCMLRVSIVCVGKLKEKFYCDACNEYYKRLCRYINLDIVEISDEKEKEISEKEIEILKNKEGEAILSKIKNDDFVVALAIDGKSYDSLELAKDIEYKSHLGKRILYVIGGSNGLSNDVLKRSNEKLSFSKFTFPHQLMRVILLEQLYRSCKINNNERYHK